MKRIIVFIFITIFLNNFSYSQDVIVLQASVWKYLDDGSDQGVSWILPEFGDSKWKKGNAQYAPRG